MDPSVVKTTVLPHEVWFSHPFGRGVAHIRVYLTTSIPRIVSYLEIEEGKERRQLPLSQSLEDLSFFVEEAKKRQTS